MPRPRVPLEKAKLTGVAAKNPQRFRDRSDPKEKKLGAAPKYLSAGAKKAWRQFAKEWPWLTDGDTALLAPLCEMRARFEDDPQKISAAFMTEYRLLISAFGGTPTSKSKVDAPGEDEPDDPFAQFDKLN